MEEDNGCASDLEAAISTGTSVDDTIYGDAGDDEIYGLDGHD